jgi:hypothetical protein
MGNPLYYIDSILVWQVVRMNLCASDLGGEAMRGFWIPRGFWLKPGGSADRVEGIIIETL